MICNRVEQAICIRLHQWLNTILQRILRRIENPPGCWEKWFIVPAWSLMSCFRFRLSVNNGPCIPLPHHWILIYTILLSSHVDFGKVPPLCKLKIRTTGSILEALRCHLLTWVCALVEMLHPSHSEAVADRYGVYLEYVPVIRFFEDIRLGQVPFVCSRRSFGARRNVLPRFLDML